MASAPEKDKGDSAFPEAKVCQPQFPLDGDRRSGPTGRPQHQANLRDSQQALLTPEMLAGIADRTEQEVAGPVLEPPTAQLPGMGGS